ncbi:hypothetical protein [Alteraurantiacibacter buctensis]|nr:hypothetical protein [Alteraurantiacibacter buctensis]
MSKAIALSRHYALDSIELLRCAIVLGCATALIAAGEMLPL